MIYKQGGSMNRRGFTLLELMIVIIIIGILATVGIMQYSATIEKSRSAEAREIIGNLRQICAAKWMETQSTVDCNDTNLGLSTATGIANSNVCNGKYWFWYTATPAAPNVMSLIATRCDNTTGSAGKSPAFVGTVGKLTLVSNYSNGSESWITTQPY
jgi:prepilin-type N-terminal cleavage/methylation domain-containing protein